MTKAVPSSCKTPFWVIGCAVAWVIVFLGCFFNQTLPNNSSSVETLTRGDIREYIAAQWTTILNPLDYSLTTDSRSGWQNFLERVPFIRTAAVLWLAAWSLGRLVVGAASGPDSAVAERTHSHRLRRGHIAADAVDSTVRPDRSASLRLAAGPVQCRLRDTADEMADRISIVGGIFGSSSNGNSGESPSWHTVVTDIHPDTVCAAYFPGRHDTSIRLRCM